MRIQVALVLSVVFLSLLSPISIGGTQVSYALGSAEPAGKEEAHKGDPKNSEADKKQETLSISASDYPKLASALVVYIVISIVLEAALTVVFNWRWFIKWFEGVGLKTPVAWLIGYLIALNYGLDIMRDVGNALTINCAPKPCAEWKTSFVGQVVTAFFFAGGSQAFYSVLSKLKIRDQLAREARVAEIASA